MNTENNDKILVIVPVINLWDRYTRQCLDSVLASDTSIPIDICLVDNASTDGTCAKALEYFKFKNHTLHLVRNENNTGCAAGWNAGVKCGMENGYSHMLIINNDILVSPKTISQLWRKMRLDPTKVLVSALDVAGEVKVPEMVLDLENEVNKKEESEAPHPHFSCFMISRETIEKVGYFDEVFYPAYFEDNSYHYRIKLLCGPDAAITITKAPFYHFGSRTQNESLGGQPVVPGPAFVENRQRFIKLWGDMPNKETFKHPYNDQTLTAKLNVDQQYQKLSE